MKKKSGKIKIGGNNNSLPSGIPGLDEILNYGFRKKSSIVVTGESGTGKSIFALQFIIEGAKNGEPGLYITTEETADSIEEYAQGLGFGIEDLEKKGLLFILEQRPNRGRLMTIEAPIKFIQQKKIKRVVLDSLTLFEYVYSESINEYRKGVLQFLMDMKDAGITILATSERAHTQIDNVQYKPEDSLFEGIIMLFKIRKAAVFERAITVDKMRGQDHKLGIYPFKIKNHGITIYPEETPFSLVNEEK